MAKVKALYHQNQAEEQGMCWCLMIQTVFLET